MRDNDKPACATTTVIRTPRLPEPVRLTDKELETLHWAAMGKTAWEIARILGRSEAVIHFHQSNIRRKFGVSTMRTALIQAIALGLVEID